MSSVLALAHLAAWTDDFFQSVDRILAFSAVAIAVGSLAAWPAVAGALAPARFGRVGHLADGVIGFGGVLDGLFSRACGALGFPGGLVCCLLGGILGRFGGVRSLLRLFASGVVRRLRGIAGGLFRRLVGRILGCLFGSLGRLLRLFVGLHPRRLASEAVGFGAGRFVGCALRFERGSLGRLVRGLHRGCVSGALLGGFGGFLGFHGRGGLRLTGCIFRGGPFGFRGRRTGELGGLVGLGLGLCRGRFARGLGGGGFGSGGGGFGGFGGGSFGGGGAGGSW